MNIEKHDVNIEQRKKNLKASFNRRKEELILTAKTPDEDELEELEDHYGKIRIS